MNLITRNEFYLVWESSCRNFIDEIKFSSPEAESARLHIHIFLRPDTPAKAMPPEKPWISTYFSLTTCPYASDTTLTANVLKSFDKKQMDKKEEKIQRSIYLVTDKERKYEELVAMLEAKNPNIKFREVDGKEQSILEVLDETCIYCKLVFLNKEEAERHNKDLHDFFCENNSCYHKRNRFYTKESLKKHMELQKYCTSCEEVFCSEEKLKSHFKRIHREEDTKIVDSKRKTEIRLQKSEGKLFCKFCPEKVFSSLQQKEIHMRNLHKKCNCSCGQYFETRQSYLEHFYSVYPLACFENRKCPHRFQSLAYQVAHHKDVHNSSYPYYCVPCQKRQIEVGYTKQKVCFKDERALRSHGLSFGHKEEEMYFTTKEKDLLYPRQPGYGSLGRPSPSRACSNINYC